MEYHDSATQLAPINLHRMPLSDIFQGHRDCLICAPHQSCWAQRRINKKKRAHVMPVFTDEWKRPFDRKNNRSRRPRVLDSREKVSGFTAVFCHDWKDDDSEEDDEQSVTPEETSTDVFPKPLASARSYCEYKEPYNPFKAAKTSSSTHATRRKYIFQDYVPPTRTATKIRNSPRIMPTYNKNTEKREHWRYTAQSLYNFENTVLQNNISTADDDEIETSNGDTVNQHRLSRNEEGVRMFEHWRAFLECNTVADANQS